MAANGESSFYKLPVEPPCPRQLEPGAPVKIGGDSYNVSTKIDPRSVVPLDTEDQSPPGYTDRY